MLKKYSSQVRLKLYITGTRSQTLCFDLLVHPPPAHTHTQFHYTETYIDDPENREWFERYRYDIPVIHLDGKFLMQHRVSEGQLRRALEKSRREKELAENS